MKQVIRYLYEYEDEKRVRNVGFIKAEKQMGQCTIHIHGKSLDFGQEKKLEVLVFYVRDGKCMGIPQGVMEDAAPVINYILKFDSEDVGGSELFEKIAGIILQNVSGKMYAAMWEEEEADIGQLSVTAEEVQEPRKEIVEEVRELQKEIVEEVQEPQKESEEAEKPVEPVRESLIEHVEKLVEQQELKEEIEEYIPPKTRTYEKIQRQDLAKLPRTQWHLANNSFLLHGFYNYHHLLYIEEGENRWIGVPGIYHEKEQVAARAFGFPQFHRITDADVELSAEEKNTFDDFGYWCRQV